MSEQWREIQALRSNRPRARRLEMLSLCFLLLLALPWCLQEFSFSSLFAQRRLANARRFLTECIPYPLQLESGGFTDFNAWFTRLFFEKGSLALQYSLAIAVLAMCLAYVTALGMNFFASRRLLFAEDEELGKTVSWRMRLGMYLVRFFAMFLRAIPEYIWAFIFVLLLGVSAWPAILALALHNCGILVKLFSETVDDLPRAPLQALRGLGANRSAVALLAVTPLSFNRWLLYFFVRWETCVRESTVIGFLGIASLGFWIEDARARTFYDEMMFFVLAGTVLVFIGDIVSSVTRGFIRKA